MMKIRGTYVYGITSLIFPPVDIYPCPFCFGIAFTPAGSHWDRLVVFLWAGQLFSFLVAVIALYYLWWHTGEVVDFILCCF